MAEPFERIRTRTAAYAKATGRVPVVLLLALLVRITLGKGVFYRQTRVGQGGRHFRSKGIAHRRGKPDIGPGAAEHNDTGPDQRREGSRPGLGQIGAESLDLFDAYHPQTILAYAMNGRPLPISR